VTIIIEIEVDTRLINMMIDQNDRVSPKEVRRGQYGQREGRSKRWIIVGQQNFKFFSSSPPRLADRLPANEEKTN